MTLLEVHLDGGNIVNGGVRLLMYQQEKLH
jgi:hypothetical protein